VACVPEADGEGAAAVLVPEDVELHWDASYNGAHDAIGAMVPADVMVYDPATGEPLQGESFELRGEGVRFVTAEDEVLFDPEPCERGCVWDAYADQYVEVELPESDTVTVTSDELGLGRVYVYVDSFPEGSQRFSAVPVYVAIGGVVDHFLIIPR